MTILTTDLAPAPCDVPRLSIHSVLAFPSALNTVEPHRNAKGVPHRLSNCLIDKEQQVGKPAIDDRFVLHKERGIVLR